MTLCEQLELAVESEFIKPAVNMVSDVTGPGQGKSFSKMQLNDHIQASEFHRKKSKTQNSKQSYHKTMYDAHRKVVNAMQPKSKPVSKYPEIPRYAIQQIF